MVQRGSSAFALVFSLLLLQPATADPGDPIAIRRSDGCFVIETMWNLAVQIVTARQFRSTNLPGVDLVRYSSDVPSLPIRSRHAADENTRFDRTLDRAPNVDDVSWVPTSEVPEPTPNAIRIRAAGPVIVIDVDGVRITFVDSSASDLGPGVRRLTKDTLVLIVGPFDHKSSSTGVTSLIPAQFVVTGTDALDQSDGSTLAVRQGMPLQATKTIRLNSRPLTLPAELESLMTAKEVQCTESQQVFAKLSATQLNFRPSDGTHTPRWNAEHMMGRELLFFSQIYAAQDNGIPVMDLNPKQMPPDYVARHPDWNGREEARQMQRVTSFTSRFAYLLRDLPLDGKAPGSNWTLRGLLAQMQRHYGEHTANVKKKFELADWPAE